MWAQGITGIVVKPDLGATPARVDHRTGVIQVSKKYIDILPLEHLKFVLLHEWAHIKGRTNSELEADELAQAEYLKLGGSLNASVKALTQILNGNNPEHHQRMYLQLQRAVKYDREINGNQHI